MWNAHILGILLMNSYNKDIFFSNYYNLQSVHFELQVILVSNVQINDEMRIFGLVFLNVVICKLI